MNKRLTADMANANGLQRAVRPIFQHQVNGRRFLQRAMHNGQYWVFNVTIFSLFFLNNEFFSWKTDENCLGLSKIMLANGADNSAVHSFQTLRTFLVNFQNVW